MKIMINLFTDLFTIAFNEKLLKGENKALKLLLLMYYFFFFCALSTTN